MNQPPGGSQKPFQGTQLMPNAQYEQHQQQIAAARAAAAVQQQAPMAYAATQIATATPAPAGGPAYGAFGGQPAPQPQPQSLLRQGPPPQASPQQAYAQQPYAPQGQPAPQQAYGQQPYGQPPGAYGQGAPPQQQAMQGAPGQAPQNGLGLPQIGIGGFGYGGMPRINLGGGDFSPAKLVGAVTTGRGFARPRRMGLIMIGLGFAFAVVNSLLVFVAHLYYPYLYSIGAIFWWGGAWLAVTGQPLTRPDGSPSPTWTRIGLAAALAFGVIIGAAMCFFNWERALL